MTNPMHDPLRTKWLINEVKRELHNEPEPEPEVEIDEIEELIDDEEWEEEDDEEEDDEDEYEDEEEEDDEEDLEEDFLEIEEVIPTPAPKKSKKSEKKAKAKPAKKPKVIKETKVKVTKAKKSAVPKKKHGEYVINMTSKPVFISGIGQHHLGTGGISYEAIKLGVVADDPHNPECGIFFIGNISDEELDNCPSYTTFLNRKAIVEISEAQKNVILQKIAIIQEKYAYQYSVFGRLITPNPLVEGQGSAFLPKSAIQRDQNVIETIHIMNSGAIKTDTDRIEVPGIGVVKTDHDAMSDFFKNIK